MTEKKPIHPEIQKVLDSRPPASGTRPDPVAHRAEQESRIPPYSEREPAVDVVLDHVAATEAGNVRVRIYAPDAHADDYGVIVYFHGGGFFSGSIGTHDRMARTLAKDTGMKVVSVNYSLAPEAAFPTAAREGYAVARWVVQHAHDLRWDGRTLAVAGDSTGGNIAAAVSFLAHDDGFRRITHQILYYPVLDLDFDASRWPSLSENATGCGLDYDELVELTSFYRDSGADPADPLASPIKRTDFSGLPDTLIVTAGHDPVRDECVAYAGKLADAGVPVGHVHVADATHDFLLRFPDVEEFHEVFRTTAEFLRV